MYQKVKTFFHVFKSSLIPQAHYYKKILHTKLSFSIRYFISLIILINLLFYFLFIVLHNPQKINFMKQSLITALNNFPEDLKIHINKGVLMTTYDRPYFFWINDQENDKVLFAVVDQSATPEKILEYNSYFLLTSKNLVINQKKVPFKTSVITLDSLTMTIDKGWASNMANTLNTPIRGLGLYLLLFVLVISPFLAIFFNLAILFLAAISIYLLFVTVHEKHSFRKTFQVVLHAATMPLILLYVLGLFSLEPKHALPYLILVVIFGLCGMYETYYDHIAFKSDSTGSPALRTIATVPRRSSRKR